MQKKNITNIYPYDQEVTILFIYLFLVFLKR